MDKNNNKKILNNANMWFGFQNLKKDPYWVIYTKKNSYYLKDIGLGKYFLQIYEYDTDELLFETTCQTKDEAINILADFFNKLGEEIETISLG